MKEDREKELIIHGWVSNLCSYYSDYILDESYEHRLYAEMALELIPRFLCDLGLREVVISRVNQYTFDLSGFLEYMSRYPFITFIFEELVK